jgi:RNA polymerase-binding protein DksA
VATKKTTKKKKTAASTAKGKLKAKPASASKVVKKKTTKKTNSSAATAVVKKKTQIAAAKPAARTTTRKRKTNAKASAPSPASAKANGPKRAVKPAPVKIEPPPLPEIRKPLSRTQLRKVKTDLLRKDLGEYRGLLVQKRTEILGDVEALQTDARSDSGDHLSPEHMADIGSINYEQEFTLGLVESERKLLVEIDEALVRIREGTYGVCLERGEPIGRPRLDAKPWAKYCIEVVREKESRGEL